MKTRVGMWCVIGVVIIAAGAAAAGFAQYHELMRQASERALSTAQAVQKYFLLQRARQLESASNIVARNPNFAGYVAHAFGDGAANGSSVGGIDTASIRDLISERRDDVGADVIAVLTVGGKLVAASGEGATEPWDLSHNATVERARRSDDSVSGFLVQGSRLLLITCTSIRHGADIQAFLLAAQNIDANVIAQATQLSHAGLAILQQSNSGWTVMRSNAEGTVTARLPTAMQDLMAHETQGAAGERNGSFQTDDGIRTFRASPVDGVNGNVELVSLLPSAFRSELLSAVTTPIVAFGGALILLLLITGLFVSRKLARPLDHLADLSTRAEQGDHALEFNLPAKGVVGRVASGFNYLTRELGRYRVPTGTPMRRATDRRAG